jgi:hypothetical protein
MARGNNKTGVAQRTADLVIQRHKAIRSVWLAIQNDPELNVADAAVEFYYAIGELLEGKAIQQIEFRKIDRKRVLQHHKDG